MKEITPVYLAFEHEFFQGDSLGTKCLGVFSSESKAEEHILEVTEEAVYDPMFRSSFQVIPTLLDVPLTDEEEIES